MIKYLFCFLTIFYLQGTEPIFAQAGKDSIVAHDTVNISESVITADSSETVGTNTDSLYKPVVVSFYKPSDSIREVPQNQVRSYLLNPDYAYANDPGYWKKQVPQKPGFFFRFFTSPFWRWVILFGVIAVVLYGIYQLAKENNFSWLTRKANQKMAGRTETATDEEINYNDAIEKYQAEGNFRLATRFLYLRLIQTARENGMIQIRNSSTNAEITRAFGNKPQAVDFRFLAMAYEYIFFGGFLPKQELFAELKNKFDAFQQTISV